MTDPTITAGGQPQPWSLPTATGSYVVAFSDATGGPVLQHWGPDAESSTGHRPTVTASRPQPTGCRRS